MSSPLNNQLINNHKALSTVGLDFIEYAMKNREFDTPLEVAKGGESLFAKEYQFDLQTLPLFMTHEKAQEYGQTAVKLFDIYKNLVLKLVDDDPALLERYFKSHCDKSVVELLKGHTGLDYCLLRGDFTATDNGFKLLEFNISGNIGGWGIFLYESMYREYPGVKKFLNERSDIQFTTHSPLNDMVKHIISVSYQFTQGRVPTIAVWLGDAGRMEQTLDFFSRFKPMLAAMGVEVEFVALTKGADIAEVDGKLVSNGTAIDSLLLVAEPEEVPEFVHHRSERGELPMFNSRPAYMLHQKSGLCLLSEYARWDECPEQDKALIDRCVPYSRFLQSAYVEYKGAEHELIALVKSHKDDFVIKPIDGSQGTDVVVGNRTEQQAWDKLVDEAVIDGHYIVQEYCLSQQLLAQGKEGDLSPHDAVWAPFVFGGQFAGNYVRLSPSDNEFGVINAHRGASDAFIFLHE